MIENEKQPQTRADEQISTDQRAESPAETFDPPVRVEYTAHRAHSGPLPAPETLREYDDVIPGLAETIVSRWGHETEHRHLMERRSLRLAAISEIGGKIAGALFLFAMVGLAAYAFSLGYETAAGIISGLTAAGVLWAFVRTSLNGSGRE